MVPAMRTMKNSVHFRKAHYTRKKTMENWFLHVILWHCVNLLNLAVTPEKKNVPIKRKQSVLYKRVFPAFFFYLPNTEHPNLDFAISALRRDPCLAKVFLDLRLWARRIGKNRLTSYFGDTKKRPSRVFNSTFKNVLPTRLLRTNTHITAIPMLSQKLPQIHSVSFFVLVSAHFTTVYYLPIIRQDIV